MPHHHEEAAEVLSWSGGMNPYKYGKLGVIEEGAYADLVLIDGNPLKDISILNDFEEKFKVIMKVERVVTLNRKPHQITTRVVANPMQSVLVIVHHGHDV